MHLSQSFFPGVFPVRMNSIRDFSTAFTSSVDHLRLANLAPWKGDCKKHLIYIYSVMLVENDQERKGEASVTFLSSHQQACSCCVCNGQFTNGAFPQVQYSMAQLVLFASPPGTILVLPQPWFQASPCDTKTSASGHHYAFASQISVKAVVMSESIKTSQQKINTILLYHKIHKQ